jgi:hypothetical protein
MDADSQFWGSCGDVGGVAPNRSENQTVEPGSYTVEIRCEGAPVVDAKISATDGTVLVEPFTLDCPSTVTVPVELPSRGIAVTLDPRGETGAYLIRIT